VYVAKTDEPSVRHPDDVKIRVHYGAINPDDYAMVNGTLRSHYYDRGLGHEISGEIVKLGPEAAQYGLAIGDAVSAVPFTSCGMCINCRSGKEHLCLESGSVNGLFSEYIVLKSTQVCKLPASMDLREGALFWLTMTCAHCMESFPHTTGQSILILGGGSAGLMLLQLARLHGACLVIVSEPIKGKRALARKLGATKVVDPGSNDLHQLFSMYTEDCGFDIIIDASGNFNALRGVTGMLARGGTLMLFSMYDAQQELNINLSEMYFLEYTVKSSFSAKNSSSLGYAGRLMGALQLTPLIGGVYAMGEIEQAMAAYTSQQYTRILLDMTR